MYQCTFDAILVQMRCFFAFVLTFEKEEFKISLFFCTSSIRVSISSCVKFGFRAMSVAIVHLRNPVTE